jgi:hypothetical protein
LQLATTNNHRRNYIILVHIATATLDETFALYTEEATKRMRFGYATIRCILFFVMVISIVDSFQARRNHPKERRCEMAKGFNKARNKQAELAKKMQLAKKEKQKENPILKAEESVEENNDQGDVAANTMDVDRQMFQRLLDSTKGAIPTDSDTDSAFITEIRVGPKKVKKKKMSPDPKEKEVEKDTKEEIRVAQRIHFESLIDIESSKKLGNIGAAKLVPWVPPYLNECLVVFADPRTNSVELRQTIKYLASACPKIEDKDDEKNPSKPKIIDQVIFVTADSVPEIQA